MLLASAEGVEDEGRRHRVVVVTDRRVLVLWARSNEVDEFPRRGCTADHDRRRSRLSIGTPDERIVLRDVAPGAADQVADLVARGQGGSLSERMGRPFHVRVIGA